MTARASVAPPWPVHYIGIPFTESGLDFDGCHCWGLVRLVLKNECRIEMPACGEISAAELLAAAKAFRRAVMGDPWVAVERGDLREFDCVLMRAMTEGGSRFEGHVGIMAPDAGSLKVLHVWRATDACLMPLDHHRIKSRVVGFYRHRDLCS